MSKCTALQYHRLHFARFVPRASSVSASVDSGTIYA